MAPGPKRVSSGRSARGQGSVQEGDRGRQVPRESSWEKDTVLWEKGWEWNCREEKGGGGKGLGCGDEPCDEEVGWNAAG